MNTFSPQLDRHVQQLKSLKHNPFFTKMLTYSTGNRCLCAMRHYPREIVAGQIESFEGEYRWQLSPCNLHSFVGGSKLRAYRRARQVIAYNRSYLNQKYVMFSGPVGILP